jgi:endonuclease YncB( thermonuclease family)
MNQRSSNNANHLNTLKYPLLAIILIALTALWLNYDWLQHWLSASAENECEVVKISDGDTITLKCPGKSENVRVRMYCIDTPESKQEPWGTQARKHLQSIISKTVHLIEMDKDRYGRIVGEVYSGSTNLNLAQVKAGQAAVYQAYCKKAEYFAAEKDAKEAKLGIWATPGIHQTPWRWRQQQREQK